MKQRDLIMWWRCETINCSQFWNNYATITWTEWWLFCLEKWLNAWLWSIRIWYREDFIWWKYITAIARINNTIDWAKKYAKEQKEKWLPVIIVWSEWIVL